MKYEGFIGASYKFSSLPISSQRCINWYPERLNTSRNAASSYILQPTPGYKEVYDFSDDNELIDGSYTRCIYRTTKGLGTSPDANGSIIVVIGAKVFWLKPNEAVSGEWVSEIVGTISNTTSRVSMIDDGFGLIIVDGLSMYRLDLVTKIFIQINFTGTLLNPTDVAFVGGYTLVIGQTDDLPQNTFFWSNQYDNSIWDVLNYASAEQSADPISAMIVAGDNIHFFGTNSHELWNCTGDSSLPFLRSYGTNDTVGIYAPQSLVKLSNNVYMIGTTDQGAAAAYVSNGSQMVKISELPLDEEWCSVDTTDCTSWSYSDKGHDFIIFNFDILDKTYVYDSTIGEWHERATRSGLTDTLHRYSPNYSVQYSNNIIVGDRYSTKLYDLSNKYATENGNTMLRVRSAAHQNAEQKPMLISAVRFDMDTGNGINIEDEDRYTQAPQLMFRYSHDRGRTWSSELRREIGRTGDYLASLEFTRLGVTRNFTCEFKLSDPCQTTILNGFIYPKIGPRGRSNG